MIIHVTLEKDSKGRWEITFQGPKQGGALKISRTLKTAIKQLAKVLLKEFPDPIETPEEKPK